VKLGTTFLIVTHDPRLAARCDRIIELVDGRIVADRPNPHPARRQPPASRPPAEPGSAITGADGKHPNIRLVSGPE
jgi:ABC-type multidrug transport system ATPase subunit